MQELTQQIETKHLQFETSPDNVKKHTDLPPSLEKLGTLCSTRLNDDESNVCTVTGWQSGQRTELLHEESQDWWVSCTFGNVQACPSYIFLARNYYSNVKTVIVLFYNIHHLGITYSPIYTRWVRALVEHQAHALCWTNRAAFLNKSGLYEKRVRLTCISAAFFLSYHMDECAWTQASSINFHVSI